MEGMQIPQIFWLPTTPEKWEEIAIEDSKLRKYEGKSFSLFEALDVLYKGNIAQGKHYFTSSKPPNVTKSTSSIGAKENVLSSANRKHSRHGRHDNIQTPPRFDINDSPVLEDEYERQNNWSVVQRNESIGRSYELQLDYNEDDLVAEDGDRDQVQRSATSGTQVKPKKQKGSISVQRIEESMMAYVNLKKEQVSMKGQAPQQGTSYSVTACLEVLNAMYDVSDEVKIYASDVFKDDVNREIFLGYNSRLRSLWLKKEVGKFIPQSPPSRCSCGGAPSIDLVL